MRRQLLAAGSLGALATCLVLGRKRQLCWGAHKGELGMTLPGDDLVAGDLVATRAVSVNATTQEVWPWLAQIGQGRGGFYSYDVLENLIGCDIHSADRTVAQWQHIQVGDEVKLHPEVALTVACVEAGAALVLRGGCTTGKGGPPYDCTWAFVLRPQLDGSTRLIMRERYAYNKRWACLLVEPVELVSFVMSRKMLHGVKTRAERWPADHSTARHSA